MTIANFMARLDHIEDGAYLAQAWSEGRARLDGWQLEYAGRAYGVPRVPGCTLRRCVAWSEGGETCFYRGARACERMTVWNYYNRLKQALETA